MSGIHSSLCGVEVTPGTVGFPDQARVGYLTIKPPLSYTYELTPKTYKSGFSSKGKIIGRNEMIPYPGELPKYHNIPFLRNVEWAGGLGTVNTHPTNLGSSGVGNNVNGTISKHHDITTTSDIDEYFTADNDEGYRQWEAKRSMTCETEVATAMEPLPEVCLGSEKRGEIEKRLADNAYHYTPVQFPTTNHTYGSYLDLNTNYPTVRQLRPKKPSTILLVKFPSVNPEKSEEFLISTMLGIDIKSLSSKTQNNVSYNPPQSLATMGQRQKCQTFPAYCPTGLEINRIPSTTRSLFSTMAHQQLFTRPMRTPLGKIRTLERQQLCMPYRTVPAKVSKTPGYICVEAQELLC